MLKNWGEYWWILPVALYCILLAVVMRRGMWATVGQKIYWITICVLILIIPTRPSPSSYLLAVLVVLNLGLYRWSLRRKTFVLERFIERGEGTPVGSMSHETARPGEILTPTPALVHTPTFEEQTVGSQLAAGHQQSNESIWFHQAHVEGANRPIEPAAAQRCPCRLDRATEG